MFKTFADFSKVSQHSPAHPGQPVHCDRGFDVWQTQSGQLFVIAADGSKQPVPSVAEAQKTIAPLIAAQAKADAEVAAEKAKLAAAEAEQAASAATPAA